MKRLAHAKQRDRNEPEIVEALRRLGCKVYLLNGPLDLLVGVGKETWLLEVKDGEKIPAHRPLTPAQVFFFRDWRGGRAGVVRCVEEALCFVGLVDCRAADRTLANPTRKRCGCGSIADSSWFTAERARLAEMKKSARRRKP